MMKFEEDLKIFLKRALIEQMIRCVENAYPNESCGILMGQISEERLEGKDNEYEYNYIPQIFKCIESNKKTPVSFLINDTEQLYRLIQEYSDNKNMKLISIFHSHPSGNHPSGTDIANMKYLDNFKMRAFKNQIWLIMDAQTHDINGFIYLNKEVMQIKVKIEN